jgi:hypothetical protein
MYGSFINCPSGTDYETLIINHMCNMMGLALRYHLRWDLLYDIIHDVQYVYSIYLNNIV